MRRRAASDGNQSAIVEALRKAGATVAPCHAVGQGFPDLVVGYRGQNFLIEVKDPTQPKHRHELTKAQVKFHAAWRGVIAKAFTPEDALDAIGALPVKGQIG